MIAALTLHRDTYLDSVLQLAGTRAMQDVAGVSWAAAAMGTSTNLDTLRHNGFDPAELAGLTGGDLFVAVLADTDEAASAAAEAARSAMFDARTARPEAAVRPRSLEEALAAQPGSGVAVISVPGDYAALEAHRALGLGLDVLLFSDNVSVADEIALKDHATRRGRLLMGPGAGTALLGGTCLGFANVVRPGRVGIVAAAGTGAQEAMALLDRWGAGVSQVIGLGGRDLSAEVAGRMADLALARLDADPQTDLVLLVSKPPAAQVGARLLARTGGKPLVAAFLGWPGATGAAPSGPPISDTLEGGVLLALAALGLPAPDLERRHGPDPAAERARLSPARTAIRGLFSGGTLCYEALVVLGREVGEVWSNIALDHRLRAPAPPGAHVCLDLGEEEYTRGRPHPMIDPAARIEALRQAATDPQVGVVLLDVVLGHGAHPDPAGALAPVCADLVAQGLAVVGHVLGTEADPQPWSAQVARLAEAGCIVTETATRAALTAAALSRR